MQDQNHLAKLILRIGFGGFMLTHGIPKLMKLVEGGEIQFADPIGLGVTFSLILTVFAEVICAGLILIGFKTKWATFPLIITMLVAAFVVHADDPFGKKEFALLYAVGFVAISLLGAGKYSIDRK
ncbi:MAG: putative oxidoreductase [Saprospiraceae bacterium]|jgi:putative oxidoreductase